MIELLSLPPYIVAIVGVVFGYFFKRVVLVVLTVPVVLAACWATYLLATIPDHSLADAIFLATIVLGFVLAVPMWATHLVKRAGGVGVCLKWLKGKTIDMEKGSE